MLKPQIWLVGLFLVSLGWLALWRDEWPAWQSMRREAELDVVGTQLDGLRDLLREYRARHGKYPTLEEGLRVLDGYAARFSTPHDAETLRWALFTRNPMGLFLVLSECRDGLGKFPRSLEEFVENWWMGARWLLEGPEKPVPESERGEIALAPNGALYVLQGGEVLSPWGLPFVYENRAAGGKPQAGAAGEREEEDSRYLRRVDEGVSVSCFEARFADQELAKIRRTVRLKVWLCRASTILCAALFGISLAVALARNPGLRRKILARTGALGAVLGGAFIVGYLGVALTRYSCYVMHFFWHWLDRDQIPTCEALLEKYRASGAIRPDTYERLRRAFEENKGGDK